MIQKDIAASRVRNEETKSQKVELVFEFLSVSKARREGKIGKRGGARGAEKRGKQPFVTHLFEFGSKTFLFVANLVRSRKK